jgi:hypothetical protein
MRPSVMWKMSMPGTVTCRSVTSMSRNMNRCVAVHVNRMAALSPCVNRSSIAKLTSGNALKNFEKNPWTPSWPLVWPPGMMAGSWNWIPGSNSVGM